MTDDPPPVQRPTPQKLPRAGQIPINPIDIQPIRDPPNDRPASHQLFEPTIGRADYRLAQQSKRSRPGIVAAALMAAVLAGLAILYWWQRS
jgi:hypothetical protein